MKPIKDIRDVEIEIRKALKILKGMPKVGPKKVKSHWPQYLNENQEVFMSESDKQYCKALPEEIDDMDEVLDNWLKCLDYDERNLVIYRNTGYSWKILMAKFNLSRGTLYIRYVKSLQKILKYVLEKQRSDGVKDDDFL